MEDKLQICFDNDCPNYGECSLIMDGEVDFKDIPVDSVPKCAFFHIKRLGAAVVNETGDQVSEEELWAAANFGQKRKKI